MKKVAAIVRLMSIPISSVASWSWAVARMAFPSVDRLTKSASTIMRIAATTMTKMSFTPIVAPPITMPFVGSRFG